VALRLIVPVDYEFVEGKHFFTAARWLGQGICVAHSELETAFDEVGRQLKVVLFQNHGFKVADAVAERRAFEQLQHLPRAGAGTAGKTSEIQWACSIVEQPTA
jgi:hypothetical protein